MSGMGQALPMTRRSLFAKLLVAAGMSTAASAMGNAAFAANGPRLRDTLSRVVKWGCQYQNIDLDAIAASDLDMIVMEFSLNDDALQFVSPAECERLKTKPDGSRRLVIAYLCVGEVDTKRWFWPTEWAKTPPSWVGAENPNWIGSRSVQYWHPKWRSLLFEGKRSVLNVILGIGFDGVFLDRVDGFVDWEATHATAKLDMVDLVAALAENARARKPDFLIIAQNAEPLLTYGDFVLVLDGHNKESLLTGLHGANTYNAEDDVKWSLNFLRALQDSGKRTFATEYLTDEALVPAVRDRLVKLGFVPFFGVRALDQLPSDRAALVGTSNG